MKKFTGDKWSFNVNRGIIFKHDNPLIRICSLVTNPNEEYEANGRLIAAAPEMYSLLCRFLHDTYPGNEKDGSDCINIYLFTPKDNNKSSSSSGAWLGGNAKNPPNSFDSFDNEQSFF